MDASRRLIHLCILGSFLFVASSRPVLGIPNATINPHPNGNGKISWQGTAGESETHNHFHLPGSEPTQHDMHPHLRDATNDYTAFAVWDDRSYRFTAPSNTSHHNVDWEKFAHGYIKAAASPRYCYSSDFPNDAKLRIKEGFETWEAAAKAKSNGKTTPDGTALKTGISFAASTVEQGCDFKIMFKDNLQGNLGVGAVWAYTESIAAEVGVVPMTLAYTTTPFSSIRVGGGDWEVRAGEGDSFGQFVIKDVTWSFDKTPDMTVDQDVDYRCNNFGGCGNGIAFNQIREGNEADFLGLNLQLVTNSAQSFAATNTVKFYQWDFWTITLHEEGHVLGMGHDLTNATTSLMRESIGAHATFGGPYPHQQIDAGSATGAAALYTIPVPEPASAAMLGLAMGMLCHRRGRRRHSAL